ncbi:hypothetical protein C0J52_08576 [Blattella germanica]|nr:hypothetical protein C0J52_08576 [Blattella germanica]
MSRSTIMATMSNKCQLIELLISISLLHRGFLSDTLMDKMSTNESVQDFENLVHKSEVAYKVLYTSLLISI